MKKFFISLLLICLTLCLFVGCADEPKEDIGNDDAVKVIYLPGFAPKTKAMSAFPTACVFANPTAFDTGDALASVISPTDFGPWMAANAMSTLPIFPGLDKITDSVKNINKLKGTEYIGYGFPLKISDIGVNGNDVYVRYDILEGDQVIGVADYFYSAKGPNGKPIFSYRELVTPFLEQKQKLGNNILYFELTNVEINEDGSFATGIKDEAICEDNCLKFYKISIIGLEGAQSTISIRLNKHSMLYVSKPSEYKDDAATEVLSTSFHTKETSVLSGSDIPTGLFTPENSHFTSPTSSSLILVPDKWDLKDCFKIMDIFFSKKGINNWYHSSNANKMLKSIEDFNSYNLELNDDLDYGYNKNNMGFCTKYILNKSQDAGCGATLGPSVELLDNSFDFGPSMPNINCENAITPNGIISLLSFAQFDEYKNSLSTRKDFAAKHLEVCGVTKGIDTFIDSCQPKSESQSQPDSDWAHYVKPE